MSNDKEGLSMKPLFTKKRKPSQTICVNCIHHLYEPRNDATPSVWYNHFCLAVPLEKEVSPITGETEGEPYAFCRDINKGNCSRYKEEVG